jgi:hypothetical protein
MATFPIFSINNYNLYYDIDEPKYYLNSKKELLIGQIFDFQIHHICQHLNIPYTNEFGTIIPNKILINNIKEYSLETLPEDCDICKKLGLYYYPKTKNNFSYNNIGGKNSNKLELDISQNYLDLTVEPLFKSDTDIIPIDLGLDYRFSIDIPKGEKIFSIKKPFLKGLIERIQKERSLIGLENIQKGKNTIDKIGKIDYSLNSSYIDVILMLINLPIQNSFFEKIIDIHTRIPKLNNPAYLSLHFPNKLTRSVLVNKLIELNRIFIEYREKINEGEIINSQKFRISLQTIFNQPGILKHPYYLSKQIYSPFDLYKDILRLNIIDNYRYTSLDKLFINKDDKTIYSGSERLPSNLVLDKVSKGINNKSETVCFEISGDILKYLITRDRYRLPAESRIYCPTCNEFINRFDKTHAAFHKSNKIMLSQLMNLQIDIIKQETVQNKGVSYSNKMFFKDSDPDTLYSRQEAISAGLATQYERAVYEYSIFNTECISFYMNRFEKRINKQSGMEEINHTYDIPVFLEEIITDKNNNNYSLVAIITRNITNNLLFFTIDNHWYLYNSMFDPDLQSDYIENIGNFQDLSNYREGLIQKTGIIYFYELQ